LEEFDHRRRKVQLLSTFNDLGLGQRIGRHPLGKVSNHFGRRGDLEETSERLQESKEKFWGALMIFPHCSQESDQIRPGNGVRMNDLRDRWLRCISV
jgi:hypothetical protein